MTIRNKEPTYNGRYAANFLCVSERTVSRWRASGKLPHQRDPQGGVRYAEADLHQAFRDKWGFEKRRS